MTSILDQVSNRNEVAALLEKIDSAQTRRVCAESMADALKLRVKGQDHVVDDLSQLIRRQWGKELRRRPIANILFLGPTGTGKTELAKAMAEFLYRNESAMLRFDCGELKAPESTERLVGVPSGYKGSERGGQLTRPVLNNPKQLILFDEIEKANPRVFDIFLSLMGEGRLTEAGSGKTADFTQSIVVLTSNAEADAIARIQQEMTDYDEMINAIKSHLSDTGVFRPEIVGRIDRVYVFEALEGMVIAEIAALKMVGLAREYGLELAEVQPSLIVDAMQRSMKQKASGIRGLEAVVNDLLAEPLLAAKEAGATKLRLEVDPEGTLEICPAAE